MAPASGTPWSGVFEHDVTFAAPALFIDLREALEPSQEIGPGELEGRLDDLREGAFPVLLEGCGREKQVGRVFGRRAL